MKTILRSLFAVALLFTAASAAQAHDYTLGDLQINHPWARASAGMAKNGAAFMTIVNGGGSDKLLSASSDVSKVVELHTHIMEGSVMRMRQVPAVEVAGGSETTLQPGGYHVMLIGLNKALVEGETFPLTLNFEKAGQIEVLVTVEAAGAMGMGAMNHGAHGNMNMGGQGGMNHGMHGNMNMGGQMGQ